METEASGPTWNLDITPEPFPVSDKDVRFAVLIAMGGDDKSLDKFVVPDLEEMARGVSDDVAVLALVDTAGPGGSKIVEVLSDKPVNLEALGEVCTGDPRYLADFLARGLVSFSPETLIAIGFWGHGTGIFSDYDPQEQLISPEFRFGALGVPIPESAQDSPESSRKAVSRTMLPDMTSGNSLTNREASSALAVAFSRARRSSPVAMLFFDTCLNSSVEVFSELRPFAETFVASSLLVPGTGWNYALWLEQTVKLDIQNAKDWACLAVAAYERVYDQRVYRKPAQLAAFSTSSDFVDSFANLVTALKQRGVEGARLAGAAARRGQAITYGENIDLGDFLYQVQAVCDDEELVKLSEAAIASYSTALLGLSMPPPNGEHLSGMTVWCPVQGDREGVGRYYRQLEFDRRTQWMELLTTPEAEGSEPQPQESADFNFSIFGFWGLKLVKKGDIQTFVTKIEDGLRLFSLAIPEACQQFIGDLVEGVYRFDGGAGSIGLPSYVVMREFCRHLEQIRGESEAFSALLGSFQRGWVLGWESCAALAKDFEKYEARFLEEYPVEAELYLNLGSMMRKLDGDGVMIFH